MKERIYWLDAARAIAIVLVVFTHCHEQSSINNPFMISLFYTIDRLGVPIFFMISGGLILEKLKNVNIWQFYKKRVMQFFILILVYSVLTNTVQITLDTGEIWPSFAKSLKDYNGILNTSERQGIYGGARQLWFMYIIIQLYLVAPFIARFIENVPTKLLVFFTLICIFLNQVRFTFATFEYGWSFLDLMGQDGAGAYMAYFLVGYLIINRNVLENINKSALYILSLALVIIPSCLLIYADFKSGKLLYTMHWYSGSAFILFSGIGLFILIKLWFENRHSRILNFMSLCSFGIFLSHYAFVYIFKFIQQNYLPTLIDTERAIFYLVMSFSASLMLTALMMRSKKLKYFVS